MSTFQELNRQGITIILVTHEHDIANYCKRIIEFRDGRIIRDQEVARPRDARRDLENGQLQTSGLGVRS
jgi:putative ABC transport system ATP-binding protein